MSDLHEYVPPNGVQQAWDAMTRRELVRVGGLGLLGVSLANVLARESRASDYGIVRPVARARSCILLFLSGGPSQYETFDPKPEARTEYRSIFGTAQSSVPGTQLCEYLPDVAAQAHRYTLIRSAHHRYTGHFGGHRYALSGFAAPGNADAAARNDDKPGLIGHAGKFLGPMRNMPVSVMAPWIATDQGSGASGGMGGGTLGRQYDPVRVEVESGNADRVPVPVFRVPEFALQPGMTPERLDQRRSLLNIIEGQRHSLDEEQRRDMNTHYEQAYEMLLSSRMREGFDLDREPRSLRDRYGMNAFGQSCLLARRVVERGARFVQVNFARFVTQTGFGWDTHDGGRVKMSTQLLPKLNLGLGTLLRDLDERGLLDSTLVVAMGEFGRTPRVKQDGGRDHWPQCYSLLMAGGGIHRGLVYGRSNRDGALPANDPVEAREIITTILTLLGIPTFQVDNLGRGAPLFPGVEPVQRLYT